jgi:predicted nucleic acid-binding protein
MGLVTSLMGKRVYLDTNVFIYALNGFPPYVPLLTELFDAIGAGSLVAVASELTLAEMLVVPFRRGDTSEEERCRAIFRASPGVELQPVSIAVLEGTARLRAALPALRTPDAIHVATAQLAGCDTFVTNDARLRAIPQLPVLLLSDLTAPAHEGGLPADEGEGQSLEQALRTVDSRLKFRFDAAMADLRNWWERWRPEDREAFKKWVDNLATVREKTPAVAPYISVRLEFAEETGEGDYHVFTPPIQAVKRAIPHWERGEPYTPTSLGELSP